MCRVKFLQKNFHIFWLSNGADKKKYEKRDGANVYTKYK